MIREYIRWFDEGDKTRAMQHHVDIARFISEQVTLLMMEKECSINSDREDERKENYNCCVFALYNYRCFNITLTRDSVLCSIQIVLSRFQPPAWNSWSHPLSMSDVTTRFNTHRTINIMISVLCLTFTYCYVVCYYYFFFIKALEASWKHELSRRRPLPTDEEETPPPTPGDPPPLPLSPFQMAVGTLLKIHDRSRDRYTTFYL